MNTKMIRRILAGILAGLIGLGVQVPAMAVVQPGGQLVRDQAASKTPHVLNGRVLSVVQVGNQMVLGGTFARARNDDSTTELSRTYLMSFDAVTGVISETFVPQPNGVVNVVLPAPDGESVFVGGQFTTIGGVARKNVAQVRISDGAVLPFDAGKINGQVKDLRISNGRLWIGGMFTHVGGNAQPALATVNVNTGAFLQHMRLTVAGYHNSGTTAVTKIDITPSGDRLVAVGNFNSLQGVTNRQVLELDISGASAAPATFRTDFFDDTCATVFDSLVQDVDYSPDGSFFVVSTTGGYGGSTSSCDSVTRFETYAGNAAVPSWLSHTGGDTTYAVEITDSVVYVGGHFRWQNNSFGSDVAGIGAVARSGLAALDPANGLPYTWNPGRARGVGVFDFLVTDAGLWVASDTDRIAASQYKGRIARMPVGGTTFPAVRSAVLPNDIYNVGSLSLTARSYRNGVIGSSRTVSGLTVSTIKGAFMINGWLYTGLSDGSFTRRTFDGTTFGTAEAVDAADKLRRDTTWRDDVKYATGMFFENGRIYYTRTGSNDLYYRYFTPESGVVGSRRMVASGNVTGISFSEVRGMFLADGKLYWSDLLGTLRRIDWRDNGPAGGPVAGTATQLSGLLVDGISWASKSLFLFQDAQGRGAPMPPQAAFTQQCASLTCEFDASGSSAPGGAIDSWQWDFGDGATSTEAAPEHSYASSGTYTVSLTVTSDRGGSSTISAPVSVTRVNQLPTAAFESTCAERACDFDATGSTDADGPLTYSWDFGDTGTGTGATPEHDYGSDGTFPVTLTVTDTDGVTASVSHDVTVTAARVDFAAAASANGNAAVHRLTVPSGVQAGDLLVLHLSLNADLAITNPDGWTVLDSINGSAVSARSWWKRATATDAGSTLAVSVGAVAKGDLSLAAYRGISGRSAVVLDHAARLDPVSSTTHSSPEVTVPEGGGWLATYWSMKSASDVTWSDLGGQTVRSGSVGVGSGRVVASLSDSGAPLPAGPAGALTGTSSVAVSRAMMFSTVIGLG